MNKLTSALFLCIILFASCKEEPPMVDFSEPILLAKDTTYRTVDVPTNVKKSILLEDIAGVKCVSCPEATRIAEGIKSDYEKGRVVILTLHPTSFPQLTKDESLAKLNSAGAEEVLQTYYIQHITGLPAGGIDRFQFPGENSIFLDPQSAWITRSKERLEMDPQVGLEVEVIPTNDRNVVVNTKTTFLSDISNPTTMSVYLTENKLTVRQKDRDQNGNQIWVEDYEHNHVLRELITPLQGIALSENAQRGTVVEKGLSFRVSEDYEIDNCDVIVVVQIAGGNPILQTAEAPIQ